MSANHAQATGGSSTITLYAVRRKEGVGIVGPVVSRSLTANEFYIGLRQPKTGITVVIRNAFDEGLARSQRHGNELAEHHCVANCQRRDTQARAADKRERRAQSLAAFKDDWQQQRRKWRE